MKDTLPFYDLVLPLLDSINPYYFDAISWEELFKKFGSKVASEHEKFAEELDIWGMNLDKLRKILRILIMIFTNYFAKVR